MTWQAQLFANYSQLFGINQNTRANIKPLPDPLELIKLNNLARNEALLKLQTKIRMQKDTPYP